MGAGKLLPSGVEAASPRQFAARLWLLSLGAALAFVLMMGSPVRAASDLTLSITDLNVSNFPAAEAVIQVGGDAAMKGSFDPKAIEVLVDGSPAATEVEAIQSEEVPSATVLLIDESGSMKGAAIQSAAQAAQRFVQSKRPVDKVGIYGFDEEFRVLQEPTSDSAALNSAITELRARKETALYDAVLKTLEALAQTDPAVSRYLIILSDGGDTASAGGLDEALAKARVSGVQIYTVGLRGNEFDAGPLQKLAEAGGGRYLEAPDAPALAELYASLAREIQNRFRLTVSMDEARRGAGSGQITIVATAQEAEAEATRGFFYPPALPKTAESLSGESAPLTVTPVSQDSWVAGFVRWTGSDYLVALMVFLIMVLLGYLLIGVLMPKRNVLEEYSDILENRRRLGPRNVDAPAQRPGEALAARLISIRGLDDPLQKRIESAGWKVRTSEFVLFHLMGLAVILGLAATLGMPMIFIVLTGAIGVILPIALLDNRARKRRADFESQVPDTLLMMANSFRAGQSFEQAMQVVSTEGPDPTRTEFRRVLAQQRLGVDPEVALRALADRMQSEAFDWVVMVTIIQRQVGGNLAEVYENIARTLRERVKLYRLVRTLTAEGRLSAIILIALPLLIGAVIFTLNREYMEPLYSTRAGHAMLALMALGMVAGLLWMRRLIRIDA